MGLLLLYGAHEDARNNEGRTAADLALYPDKYILIRDRVTRMRTFLEHLAKANLEEAKSAFRDLGQPGTHYNLHGRDGRTPLHYAVRNAGSCHDTKNSWVTLVRVLIDRVAVEVNIRDCDGNTPLHYAVFNENALLARFLVARGARVDVQNREGISPMSANASFFTNYVFNTSNGAGTSAGL